MSRTGRNRRERDRRNKDRISQEQAIQEKHSRREMRKQKKEREKVRKNPIKGGCMKSANANPHILKMAAYFALSRAVPISAIIASTAALDASAKCSSPYFAYCSCL